MSEPVQVSEQFPQVVRMLLDQWLYHNDVGMSAVEYVAAGRRGLLPEELSVPFRTLFGS